MPETAPTYDIELLGFPDIALPSLADGSPTSIADFRGQKVIMQVFASW